MTPSVDIFVFVDALGWRLAEERGFLRDLLPYRNPCDTIFGYSCTCDPTILTGRLPHEHGHFSFFAFDPQRSPFRWARRWGWLPERLAGHHRIRNRISRAVARRMGYTGYFQLYSVPFRRLPWLDYTEKRDLYEPGGIIGGQETIFELWRRSGVPWMRSDWRAGDTANVRALKDELARGRIRLAYLFNAGLDAVMHAQTTRGEATDAAFARLEGWLREIHATAAAHYQQVRLHVFSDHGMVDTRAVSRMMPEFESLGLEYGRDYGAAWDSTMVRFWFPGGPEIRARIEAFLHTRSEGRIVTDEELARWGCLFADRRYGELIYLLEEGTIFAPSYMNQGRVPAMHGFDPDLDRSRACWLTSAPVPSPPTRIDGIHRVMRAAAERAGR